MTTPRRRIHRHWLAIGLLAFGFAVWAVGCKQGDGERCQKDSDCEGSRGDPQALTCNLATLTCSSASTSGQIDANVADGPPPDAAVDAVDAPPDSSIDAPTD